MFLFPIFCIYHFEDFLKNKSKIDFIFQKTAFFDMSRITVKNVIKTGRSINAAAKQANIWTNMLVLFTIS